MGYHGHHTIYAHMSMRKDTKQVLAHARRFTYRCPCTFWFYFVCYTPQHSHLILHPVTTSCQCQTAPLDRIAEPHL